MISLTLCSRPSLAFAFSFASAGFPGGSACFAGSTFFEESSGLCSSKGSVGGLILFLSRTDGSGGSCLGSSPAVTKQTTRERDSKPHTARRITAGLLPSQSRLSACQIGRPSPAALDESLGVPQIAGA